MASEGFNENVELVEAITLAVQNIQFTANVIRYLSEPSQFTAEELSDLAIENLSLNNQFIIGEK